MDHCKFCKCRGCASCYSLQLPAWTKSNPVAVQTACSRFGSGICNASGTLSATLTAAWAHWNYNNTHTWIDDIFTTTYRKVVEGFQQQTVAAEFGLGKEEWEAAIRSDGDGAPAE